MKAAPLTCCPYCFSPDAKKVLQAKEMSHGTFEPFDYAVCDVCASVYILKFPEDIAAYYAKYYSFEDSVPTIERSLIKQFVASMYSRLIVKNNISQLIRGKFRSVRPWEMQFVSPNLQAFLYLGVDHRARILDVGSGNGEFVRMMKRFGFSNAEGIDPFLIPSKNRPEVRRMDIIDVDRTFDVILFNHSLEHMERPEQALKRCRDLLKRNGVIVIQVPNLDSTYFSRYQENWCWLHAPYHFAMPSRKGLQTMSARCGFSMVDAIGTSRPDHYLYSEEYEQGISDRDPRSVRRQFEQGIFDRKTYRSLACLAHSLNSSLTGDWIAFYLRSAE